MLALVTNVYEIKLTLLIWLKNLTNYKWHLFIISTTFWQKRGSNDTYVREQEFFRMGITVLFAIMLVWLRFCCRSQKISGNVKSNPGSNGSETISVKTVFACAITMSNWNGKLWYAWNTHHRQHNTTTFTWPLLVVLTGFY